VTTIVRTSSRDIAVDRAEKVALPFWQFAEPNIVEPLYFGLFDLLLGTSITKNIASQLLGYLPARRDITARKRFISVSSFFGELQLEGYRRSQEIHLGELQLEEYHRSKEVYLGEFLFR
jgi:hypothetical protein